MNFESFRYYIDIVSNCNLACPSCPVGNYPIKKKGGLMEIELFEKIIKKAIIETPNINSINLYNWTEPFLHPDLPRFIEIVKKYNLICGISTNFNLKKNLKEVLKAKPDYFIISVSGFEQETYSQTHLKGDIEKVKENMKTLKQYLNELNSNLFVQVSFHIYKDNFQQDLVKMSEFCNELGFYFKPQLAYFTPVEKYISYFNNALRNNDRSFIEKLFLKPEVTKQIINSLSNSNYDSRDCSFRKSYMTINYDGSINLCCATFEDINKLSKNFLDLEHNKIQDEKYKKHICKSCMNNKINMVYALDLYSILSKKNSLI